MPQVQRLVSLADDVVKDAARWYAANDVPKAFRDCHPLVLAYVKRSTHGDWQRCVRNADGSVTIHNGRRWART